MGQGLGPLVSRAGLAGGCAQNKDSYRPALTHTSWVNSYAGWYESASPQERGSGCGSTRLNTPNIFPSGPCIHRRNILTNTYERRPQPHRAKPADRAPNRAPHGKPARPAAHARPGHPGKSQPGTPRGRIPCRDRPLFGPPYHPRRPLRRRRAHPHPIRPAGTRTASRPPVAPPAPRPAITGVVASPFPLVLRARTPHRSRPPAAWRPAQRHTRPPVSKKLPPIIARTPANALAESASHPNRRTRRFPALLPLRQRPDHPLSTTLCKNRQWQQRIPARIMLRQRN